jgi:hypothetical protein
MSDPYSFETRLQGGVFRKADPKAKKSAVLRVDPDGVHAEVSDGTTVHVPFRGMHLKEEPDTGTLHAIAHDRSVTVFSDDPDFLRGLEAAGGNDLANTLSRLKGEKVSRPYHQAFGCLLAVVALWAIFWGVPRVYRWTVDTAVGALPYSVDEAIGEAVFGEMDLGGPEVTDPEVRGAVETILERLGPHTSLPDAEFTFKVIDSEVVNAFALPGGYFVVFTGLMREADSPEQVAGVIAHEMAHVTERHGLRRIAHSLGIWAGVSLVFGNADMLTGIAVQLFTLANVNAYSQDQETEADLEGARMLVAARIDPAGLADFFATLEEEMGDVPDALSWMSSHPQHTARVEAITAYAAEHGAGVEYEPLDVDWDAVLAALGAD